MRTMRTMWTSERCDAVHAYNADTGCWRTLQTPSPRHMYVSHNMNCTQNTNGPLKLMPAHFHVRPPTPHSRLRLLSRCRSQSQSQSQSKAHFHIPLSPALDSSLAPHSHPLTLILTTRRHSLYAHYSPRHLSPRWPARAHPLAPSPSPRVPPAPQAACASSLLHRVRRRSSRTCNAVLWVERRGWRRCLWGRFRIVRLRQRSAISNQQSTIRMSCTESPGEAEMRSGQGPRYHISAAIGGV
jgi:hypothetical protein